MISKEKSRMDGGRKERREKETKCLKRVCCEQRIVLALRSFLLILQLVFVPTFPSLDFVIVVNRFLSVFSTFHSDSLSLSFSVVTFSHVCNELPSVWNTNQQKNQPSTKWQTPLNSLLIFLLFERVKFLVQWIGCVPFTQGSQWGGKKGSQWGGKKDSQWRGKKEHESH